MPNFRRRYEQSNIYLPYRTFTHTIRWSIYVRNTLQSTRIALTQHYWHTVTQSSQTDWPMNNWHNSDQPHTQTSQLGGHQHSHRTPSQKTLLNVLVITSARYSEHTWYAMTSHPTDLARDSLPPTHVSAAAAFWCV